MNNKLCKNKKSGFTLAEVLITLAVIGIVASLTIPTLMNSSQENQRKSQLKTAYSQISNVIRIMSVDHPSILSDYSAVRSFKADFMPYFKVLKDCGAGSCPSAVEMQSVYQTYNNGTTPTTNAFDDGQFILTNGSEIFIENGGWPNTLYISVDVNSYKNEPNTFGVDMFLFQLTTDNTIKPAGAPGTDYETASTYCSDSSNNGENGLGCTYYILTDQDYPEP